jgi:hypothetical protein
VESFHGFTRECEPALIRVGMRSKISSLCSATTPRRVDTAGPVGCCLIRSYRYEQYPRKLQEAGA